MAAGERWAAHARAGAAALALAAPPSPALAAAAAPESRVSLGVFGTWGAFRDADPARCFAISTPARTGGRPAWRPYASVVRSPGHGAAPMLFVRLSAAVAPGAPVTLSVGERRFRLVESGSAARSADAPAARALVAALRGQRSMSVAWLGAAGRPFADVYLLAGAATAIDAAALGCLPGG